MPTVSHTMKGTRKGSHGGIYLGFFVFPTVLQSRGGELSLNECTLMQTALPPNVFTGLQHNNKNAFWGIWKGNLHEASKWQPPFMKCRLPLLGLQTWAHRDSMDYPKASNEHTCPFRSHHPFYLLEQNASSPSTQFSGKPSILCCFQRC
ncbi:unnamed protein product [Ixodes persulcatus]